MSTDTVDLSKPLEEMTLEELTHWGYANALRRANGNKTHAAKQFGVSLRSVYNYLGSVQSLQHRNNSDCKPSE